VCTQVSFFIKEFVVSMSCFSCFTGFFQHAAETPSVPAGSRYNVEIIRLSGEQLCKLCVGEGCTVQMLKFQIQQETNISWMRQKLIHGSAMKPLEDCNIVTELADAAGRLALQFIQLAKPIVEPASAQLKEPLALQHAIQAKDVDKCLALLAAPELASLNSLDYTHGCSVLHHAAWLGLAEVCEAILDRPDFVHADTLDTLGMTALHCAAHASHLGAVHTLVTSKAFNSVDSRDAQFDRTGLGYSARDIADMCGHTAIVKAIDASGR